MSVYNPSRYNDQILNRFANNPPSFTIHFHQEHWLINQSRPHLYHTPISFLLDEIRERRMPTDWLSSFDQNGITFYDGCLIIDLYDHRVATGDEKPVKERVILQPSGETLWADIRSESERNGKIATDKEAMEVEARILAATSAPLCLDPDPLITRVANGALRGSELLPPAAFKRKQDTTISERDDAAKAREAKIMALMNPHVARPMRAPSRLYEFLQRKQAQTAQQNPFEPDPEQQPMPGSAQPLPSAPVSIPAGVQGSPATVDATRKTIKIRKKTETQDSPVAVEAAATLEPISQGPQATQQQQIVKAKRKASTGAPSSAPIPKKRPPGKKDSTESSPATPYAPLPNVPTPSPLPVAYPLPPSTALPFAAKKSAPPKKLANVNPNVPANTKTEPGLPNQQSNNSFHPINSGIAGPYMGMVANNAQTQGTSTPSNLVPKGKAGTPAPLGTPHQSQVAGKYLPKQESSGQTFTYLGHQGPAIMQSQFQPQQAQGQQTQSTPTSSPHPQQSMLPQFQGAFQQQPMTQHTAMTKSPSGQSLPLNRSNVNGGNQQVVGQAHPHMMAAVQQQSPFQQHLSVSSPQVQSQGTPQASGQQIRSPHPQHLQVPSRPPSSQQPHAHASIPINNASYLQPQHRAALHQLHQQQILSNPNFPLQTPGNPNIASMGQVPPGWRLRNLTPQQQLQLQQQQLLQQPVHMFPHMGGASGMPQFVPGMGNLPARGPMPGQGQGQGK